MEKYTIRESVVDSPTFSNMKQDTPTVQPIPNAPWRRLKLWALPLLALTLPFGHGAVTVAMVIVLLTTILNSNAQPWIKEFRLWYLLPVAFLVLHIVGLAYSDNRSFGLFDIQVKSGLLILPICVMMHGRLSAQDWQRFVRAFLAGLLLAFVACLLPAIRTWSATGSLHGFFYQDFSRFLHPSYFAWYADTAVLLLWLNRADPILKGALRRSLLLMLSLLVFLCNSKAGFAGWFFVTALGALVTGLKTKSFRLFVVSLLHILIFGLAIWKVIPPEENRVMAMQQNLSQDTISGSDGRSTSARLHVWSAAWSLIQEAPVTGYGTGDVKDVLLKRYAERGLISAVEKKLNAHNQFLQSWVALGLSGVLLLLAMLAGATWRFRRDPLFAGFLLLTFFNFLVESMLEIQAGVVFWALFYSVFLNLQSPEGSYEDHQPGRRPSPVH